MRRTRTKFLIQKRSTENTASKKCYLPPIADNIFQYVSLLTEKIDIVIEQNSEYFSDIDFARD